MTMQAFLTTARGVGFTVHKRPDSRVFGFWHDDPRVYEASQGLLMKADAKVLSLYG